MQTPGDGCSTAKWQVQSKKKEGQCSGTELNKCQSEIFSADQGRESWDSAEGKVLDHPWPTKQGGKNPPLGQTPGGRFDILHVIAMFLKTADCMSPDPLDG